MSTLTQFFGSGGGGSTGIPCELLVVGGGAGGVPFYNSTYGGSGGGGGSGRLVFTRYTLPFSTSAVITVGAGGGVSTDGTRSSFDDILSAGGGARGGGWTDFSFNGGSGGGFNAHPAGYTTGVGECADTFNTPNFISAASRAAPQINVYADRSGGGAGGPGAGLSLSITGSSVLYAKGGPGGPNGFATPQNGAANTGTGGNGSSATNTTGSGGSGVVIIAYPDTYAIPSAISGTYNEPTRSGYRVYRFTGSGSITLPAA